MEKNMEFDKVFNPGEVKIELSDLRDLKEEVEAELSSLSRELENFEKKKTIALDSLNDLVSAVEKKDNAICSKTSDEYLALCEEAVSKETICLKHVSNYDNAAHKNCSERIKSLKKKLETINNRILTLRGKS